MTNEVQPIHSEDTRPTITSPAKPDLETVKSIYYWLNAKPDTNIKLLEGRKRINLGDIYSINERVNEKLENHKVENYIATISIILSNGKIKEYGAWAEFERENWDAINESVKALLITWDLTIKLPKFELPQRHALKIRIGKEITPKDAFQMMFASDDLVEIKENMAYGICKVDFINQVLSTELIGIVDNWYEGLPNIQDKSQIQNFLEKYQNVILGTIVNYSPVFIFFVLYIFADLCCNKFGWSTELNLISLIRIVLIGIFVFTTGIMIGKIFARGIEKKIRALKDYSGFIITKGDKNHNENIKNLNSKITSKIFLRIILGAASGGTAVLVKFILDKIIN